jgi:hypothetical protein
MNIQDKGRTAGRWTWDFLGDIWDFLNSSDLNFWLSWSGIIYTAIFLALLVMYMVILRPRAKVEWGFTWLMMAFFFVLVRFLARFVYDRPTEFWGSLTWLNVSAAITYTVYAMLSDPSVRKRPWVKDRSKVNGG